MRIMARMMHASYVQERGLRFHANVPIPFAVAWVALRWLLWRGRRVTWLVAVNVGLWLWLRSWLLVLVVWTLLPAVVLAGFLARSYWSKSATPFGGGRLKALFDALHSAGQARAWKQRFRTGWPVAATNAKLVDANGAPARLGRTIDAAPGGVSALVHAGKIGKTASDVIARAEVLAASLQAELIRVDYVKPSLARVHVRYEDTLKQVLTLDDFSVHLSRYPLNRTGVVPYGIDDIGSTAYVSASTSLLLVGLTGSGKSSVTWALLDGLFTRQIPHCLWVIDNKGGIELSALEQCDRSYVKAYVTKDTDALDLLRNCATAMRARGDRMRRKGQHKHYPTPQSPLNIVVIDEGAALLRRMKGDDLDPLYDILQQGRAHGFVVWVLSQAGQVDVLGRLRDYIPQRICLATRNRESTDAVLGQGAEASGAFCSRITRQQAGVGYYWHEDARSPVRFRAAFLDDRATNQVAERMKSNGLGGYQGAGTGEPPVLEALPPAPRDVTDTIELTRVGD